MKVLFIDDEWWTMEYLERAISWESLDMKIVGKALNGKEALSMIEENTPDMAIVDIRMPVMDGIEFIQWVYDNAPGIKVIVLSAYSEFEYARKALSLGAAGYLLKPVNEKKLLEEVTRVIEMVTQERQLQQLLENVEDQGNRGGEMDIPRNKRVQQVVLFVEENYDKPLTLEDMARQVGLSRNYLCRLYKMETGQHLWDFLSSYRMEKAKELLARTNLKSYEVAEKVGFDNPGYFGKIFKKYVGMPPLKFRS